MTVAGTQLALSLNSKVAVDALCRLHPYSYRQRLPSKVPNAANRRVLQGTLTRIVQSTSSDGLVVKGVPALPHEAHHYKRTHHSAKCHPKPKPRKERERKAIPKGPWTKLAAR